MKKFFAFPLLLVLTGFLLTSCNKEDATQQSYDEVQLRTGIWTVNQVAINSFDGQGYLLSTDIIPFGEGKDGGICTFSYTEDGNFVLNDNGNVYTYSYDLDGRVIYADNGDEWGIRKLEDDALEIVLRGDEVYNPCAFSASGAVYYLTRSTK